MPVAAWSPCAMGRGRDVYQDESVGGQGHGPPGGSQEEEENIPYINESQFEDC